jgi:flagellar hook-associated protein 3 FlgL
MRVTKSMIYRQVMQDLGRATERLGRDQLQIATGRDINKPSDNPVDAQAVLSLQSKIKEIDRYLTNVDNGATQIDLIDNAMATLTNLVGRMQEIAIQGGNDTASSDTTDILAAELDQLIDNMVEVANTQVDGKYLFGGTNTQTKPYAAARDSSTNRITAVSATGVISGIFYREVAAGTRLQTNVSGEAVFNGSVPLFDLAMELRDALVSNDHEAIRNTLDRMEELTQLISITRTQLGARGEQLQSLRERLVDTRLQLTELKSDKEDVDLTAAVAQLAQDELQYQAALSAATNLMRTNLVDFVR